MASIYRVQMTPPQNGLANTSHTIGMKASSGISLIQRSARDDGSALPLATPLSRRPIQMKYASSTTTRPSLACNQPAPPAATMVGKSGMTL